MSTEMTDLEAQTNHISGESFDDTSSPVPDGGETSESEMSVTMARTESDGSMEGLDSSSASRKAGIIRIFIVGGILAGIALVVMFGCLVGSKSGDNPVTPRTPVWIKLHFDADKLKNHSPINVAGNELSENVTDKIKDEIVASYKEMEEGKNLYVASLFKEITHKQIVDFEAEGLEVKFSLFLGGTEQEKKFAEFLVRKVDKNGFDGESMLSCLSDDNPVEIDVPEEDPQDPAEHPPTPQEQPQTTQEQPPTPQEQPQTTQEQPQTPQEQPQTPQAQPPNPQGQHQDPQQQHQEPQQQSQDPQQQHQDPQQQHQDHQQQHQDPQEQSQPPQGQSQTPRQQSQTPQGQSQTPQQQPQTPQKQFQTPQEQSQTPQQQSQTPQQQSQKATEDPEKEDKKDKEEKGEKKDEEEEEEKKEKEEKRNAAADTTQQDIALKEYALGMKMKIATSDWGNLMSTAPMLYFHQAPLSAEAIARLFGQSVYFRELEGPRVNRYTYDIFVHEVDKKQTRLSYFQDVKHSKRFKQIVAFEVADKSTGRSFVLAVAEGDREMKPLWEVMKSDEVKGAWEAFLDQRSKNNKTQRKSRNSQVD